MRFLGIDPGYARLGYGIIHCREISRPEAEGYGVLGSTPGSGDAERILDLASQLEKLLSGGEFTLCAIEDVYVRKSLTTAVKLLEARGVILYFLAKYSIPWVTVNPKEMKKLITGYGNSEKKQVQIMMQKILKLDELPQPDDAADGLAFSVCAWLRHRAHAGIRTRKGGALS